MGINYPEWASSGRESFFKTKLSTLRNLHDLKTITAKEASAYALAKPSGVVPVEKSEESEKLELLTLIDEQSQLYNYQHFKHTLSYEINRGRRYRRYLSVCLIGIDNASNLKNRLGQAGYNYVIKALSKVLKESLRDVDFPARFDEVSFGVILPETNFTGLTVAAERIRTKFKSAKLFYGSQEFSVSASLGCVTFPTHAKTDNELLEQAKKLLETAQQRGGNTVCMG